MRKSLTSEPCPECGQCMTVDSIEKPHPKLQRVVYVVEVLGCDDCDLYVTEPIPEQIRLLKKKSRRLLRGIRQRLTDVN